MSADAAVAVAPESQLQEQPVPLRRKRIVVFEAHGDDMEFTCGGTIAKFTSAGHEVTLVVATDNDKGSFEFTADQLRAARDREIHAAAAVLGVGQIICLGYPDGELREKAPPHMLRGQFMRIIREIKPDIMFTWDPFTPYEGHPDHRAVAMAAHEAASFAHFPLYYPEQLDDGLRPHYVTEHWYFAKAPRDLNKFIDITDTIDRKIEALCCHESQMVLTVQDLLFALDASGLDVQWLTGRDPHDYREVIDRQVRAVARAVGREVDYEYAEGFRATRFAGIERFARDQVIPDDV